ncbi:MAG: cytochrome c-type biogenesis protein CcmH [Longimicrobiales bacterium]|nr:cytochrome c-type biogenesis protein CcmH [Longimicrobiales bacterium]
MSRVVTVILMLGLAVPGAAIAQESTGAPSSTMEGLTGSTMGPLEDSAMEARATRLAAELRCPVCQGLSIQDSPSPLAQQMKDLIRSQVVEGRTDEEIHQYFISKYGEWVLLEPKAEGFNLVVYLLPALALLAGAGLIVVAVRRWTVPPEEGVESSAP